VNSAAMNVSVQVSQFYPDLHSFGYMPRIFIFASYLSDDGLISRIYRELKKLNSQKTTSHEEMGK
jgi:hypothetical protein